jgi:hypothetical protein
MMTELKSDLKRDLISTWNEVEEAITSMNELTDEELIANKKAILDRLHNSLYLLGRYVKDDDVIDSL